MPLTPSQATQLKAHILANTNTVIAVDTGQPAAIRSIPDVGDNYARVADWYNGIALPGDNQPLAAPTLIWRPVVTIGELNSAIVWGADPAGGGAANVTNSWLKWQSMCWANSIDMTDAQVRQGVQDVWGATSATAVAIAARGCGRQDGTRLEVLLASASINGGRVSPIFGYRITGPEIYGALVNG